MRHQTKPILDYNIVVIYEAPRRPRSAGAPLNVLNSTVFFLLWVLSHYILFF
jgi:hypothetical protein